MDTQLETTETAAAILTIAQSLNAVMKDVGAIAKKDKNQAQGFNFRGIDSVVNAVSPALQKYGVVVVPHVEDYQYSTVEIGKNRTAMGHVRVKVTYAFIGPAGDAISATVVGEAMDSGDKATNKAMSAAYKYAAFQAFAIPTEGDNDADAQTHYVEPLPDIDLNVMLDHLAAIVSTTTEDELKKAYIKAYSYASGSPDWQKKIIAAKDKMKGKL